MAARAAEPAQPEVARAAAEQEQGATTRSSWRLGTLNDVLAGAPSLSASPEYASASEDMQHCASSASPLASRDSTRMDGAEDGRQSRRTSSGSSEYGAASSRQQRKKGMGVSDQHSHAFVDKLPISSSAVYMNQTRLEPQSKSDTSEREEARLSSQTSLQVQEETLVSRTFPTSSRRSSFMKTGSSMPTSSSAQKQLWESGGISASTSNNTTLVAASSSIPSYIRSHFRSGSGGTIVGMSRTSSSSSEAIAPMNGEHIRYSGSSMPVTDREKLQAKAEDGLRGTPLPVAPSTCSSTRDRPRNGGSALRYQRGSRTSQYLDHARHPISPAQLSPLMPLIFQPDLPLEMLNYTNKSARVLHTIYPLLYYLHIPLTLFLDFNAIYALVQIASHPTPQDSATTGTGIQGEPRVNPWWIAVGFYALSTLTWLVVVVILHDIWYSYRKVWKNRNPSIMNVYLSAPTLNLSCTRSYNVFCALWRLRLSAFTGIGSVGPSHRQGIIECSHAFMQNWPTIITVIPRGLLSLVLLVSFTSTTSAPATRVDHGRDSAYFQQNGVLSTYSIVFNLINVCWALWRILLAMTAACIYLYLVHKQHKSDPSARPVTPGDTYTIVSSSWPSEKQSPESIVEWKRNLKERVIELVLLCSSSNKWKTSREHANAFKQSRNSKYLFGRTKKNRRSTVTFEPDQAEGPEMQERPPSNLSFNVHLPARAASAPLAGGIEIDEAGRELRVSSIPTRRKNKVSTDSTASSIFSPNGTTESLATERPFSALGHHTDQENRHLSHTRTRSGPSSDISPHTIGELVVDEEELERLAWEKHPPLTPRGSLVQAREELAQQQKDRSYWNVGEPTSSGTYCLEDEVMEHSTLPGHAGHNSHIIDRDLHAIVEESDEEASLRRANSLSNRHTTSSRQSSLRRASTPGTRLDDGAGIPVIEERSEHGQFPST